jgi:phosphoribosylformimino-5-aminoimidazole carboxamide ribotide isomerase
VVRYVQGRFSKKVYSKDPVKTARHWVKLGAQYLHLVDLDGAIGGVPKNLSIVRDIIKAVDIPVEFGGGIRNSALIKKVLGLGAERIVLGTKAAEDALFLKKALGEFKERVIVSVDALGGKVMVRGWQARPKGLDALSFACALKKIGFAEIIYTDTAKDGTLGGPNIKAIKELLKKSALKLIASGGISSLDDIFRLKKLEKDGLKGIIIGKALYEGRFTLTQALKMS